MSGKSRPIVEGDGDRRHGSTNGYTNLGCRCDDCSAAHVKYLAGRKKKRSLTDPQDPRHGTANGYGNYSCRCTPCTDAWTADGRDRARRRKLGQTDQKYIRRDLRKRP